MQTQNYTCSGVPRHGHTQVVCSVNFRYMCASFSLLIFYSQFTLAIYFTNTRVPAVPRQSTTAATAVGIVMEAVSVCVLQFTKTLAFIVVYFF